MIIQDSNAAMKWGLIKNPSFEQFIMYIRGLVPNRQFFNKERFMKTFGLWEDFVSFVKESDRNLEKQMFLYTLRTVGDYAVNVLAERIYYYNALTSRDYDAIGYVLYRAFTDTNPNAALGSLINTFPTKIVEGVSRTFEILKLGCEQQTRYAQLTVAFMYENYNQK